MHHKLEALKGRNRLFFDYALAGLSLPRILYTGRCPALNDDGLSALLRLILFAGFEDWLPVFPAKTSHYIYLYLMDMNCLMWFLGSN
jgi:hypothetical protein